MATGTATYQEQAGHDYVAMSGNIKTDAQFTTQPIASDQIIFPTGLSVDAQLNISGAAGNYEIWHIIASSGLAEKITYGISSSESVTYQEQAGYDVVTLSGTILNDSYFPVQPVANDQIIYPDTLTVTAQLNISGAGGNYEIWHIVESTGLAYHVNYQIGSGVGGGAVTYQAGTAHTTATLASGFDAYAFEGWSPQPVASQQLTTETANGYFDSNGDYRTDLEHVHDAWHTDTDGTITHFLMDSDLTDGADLTPDVFSLTAVTDQPTNTLVISNSITVLGIDSGLDIPVSVSAGAAYSVSNDGGFSWTPFTSTPGTVTLNDQVRIRITTSTLNDTETTGTLTLNTVSGIFSATTAGATITSPTQFNFTDKTGIEPSTVTESDPVTILGMSTGVNALASVIGGDWAKSTDSGVSYSAYSSSAGTVKTGDLVKLRVTSNASYSGFVNVSFTVATVEDTWQVVNQAAPPSIDPDFWDNNLGDDSVINDTKRIDQDKDATGFYWLHYSDLLDGSTIVSFQIDPNSELTGITIDQQGLNAAQMTDLAGNTYATNTLIGFKITGGTLGESYNVVIRITLSTGRVTDITQTINIVDK